MLHSKQPLQLQLAASQDLVHALQSAYPQPHQTSCSSHLHQCKTIYHLSALLPSNAAALCTFSLNGFTLPSPGCHLNTFPCHHMVHELCCWVLHLTPG